ncbi:hypothetical protein EMPS_00450 [Entomortierella parvispora]|uniref:Zn(2)-C6 fungal-type domain-containing protein n=1 Tax=Entomortierella parvispora TaxID=205924 RepID=A0A9P3H104_9FUNG|nr:hypothetical protein EMPS_00450 [Entomortierella parvispora]
MSHSYLMETEVLRPESPSLSQSHSHSSASSPHTPMTPMEVHPSPMSEPGLSLTPLQTGTGAGAQPAPRVKSAKAHVPSACINCKKAHLACDLSPGQYLRGGMYYENGDSV